MSWLRNAIRHRLLLACVCVLRSVQRLRDGEVLRRVGRRRLLSVLGGVWLADDSSKGLKALAISSLLLMWLLLRFLLVIILDLLLVENRDRQVVATLVLAEDHTHRFEALLALSQRQAKAHVLCGPYLRLSTSLLLPSV